MGWEFTDDVELFRTAAGGYLRERPAECTLLLTISESLRQYGNDAYGGERPRFGWWRTADGSPVTGAFVQTPPHRPVLGPMPEAAARQLAVALRRAGVEPGGVSGRQEDVLAFADAWGRPGRVHRRERLYRLGELSPPRGVPGAARPAGPGDAALLARWLSEFAAAIGEPPADRTRQAERRIAEGTVLLWEVKGEPVAMAARTPVLLAQSRVASVYTPPELRGRGYAGGATAAVSAAARAAGAAEVLLFTDLANPTSNALYQRLGYRAVEDRLVLDLP
jgi:GNAT superfamily N-acetyltransferase